jgi:hypothetical protein
MFQGARLCHAMKRYFVFEILTSRALYIAEEALPVRTPTFLLSVVVFFLDYSCDYDLTSKITPDLLPAIFVGQRRGLHGSCFTQRRPDIFISLTLCPFMRALKYYKRIRGG